MSIYAESAFFGGQISSHLTAWQELTDYHILQIVSGDIIDFSDHPLINHKATNPSISAEEEGIIDLELMMLKRVIIPCGQERIECVSPIFITPKSDGGHRLILNLKRFNDAVVYQHFKMDSIKTVLQLITPNCYMCKVDLRGVL